MSVRVDVAGEAPFLGLRYFDEDQSHLFFGREVQASDILDKLRRSRLVTVMGGSGSGKSSLVRAGVVPSLKAGFLGDAGPRWYIAKMRPGGSPIANLGRALEAALSVPDLEVTLRRGPLGLVQAVEQCRLAPRENVLVIVDQFEELFRYQRESDHEEAAKGEAAAFVKLLLEATNQRALSIYVIVTMRSDYLGNCAQFRDLPERINEGLYLVPRMRRDQLEQAISGPVAVEDAAITARLVQKLLNDTGDDPDQLPVLQHALLRAWNTWKQAPRPLDLEDLDAVGGMKESLSRHADEIFERLTAEQRRIARVIFQQLGDRDPEGREIRRPAPVAHVAAVAGVTVAAVEDVVGEFAAPEAAFLYRNEDGHLDITHESLIRKWRLIQGAKLPGGGAAKGWMQEEVEARDQFRLLAERAAKNDALMRRALDDAIAWRGLGLNGAWSRRYTREPDGATAFSTVLRFIEACEKEDATRRRRRTWLFAGFATALVVVLVVVLGLWQSAARQARAAGIALSRASTQEAARLVERFEQGQALAHLARALRADTDSIAARGWISDLLLNGTGYWPGPRLTHMGEVRVVSYSPDGRRVATASDDSTGRLWDAASGESVGEPLRHKDRVIALSFSPDGRRLVTTSADSTARVWDAATGQAVGEPMLHKGQVASVVFSLDGRHILTTCPEFGTAHIWDLVTGKPVGIPLQHDGALAAARFSPGGRHVWTVTAAAEIFGQVTVGATTCVSDVAVGQPVCTRLPHEGELKAAAISPDGGRIMTVSYDSAWIWTTNAGPPIGMLLPYKSILNASVEFSPDGTRVLTTSHDGTARVWDAATGGAIGAALEHTDEVVAARFSGDGSRIVTASTDHTARVWDAATGRPIGAPLQHQGPVTAATFNVDGQRVVTASGDATARIWLAAILQPGGTFRHDADVVTAVFSPDGNRVVTASDDDTARVWEMNTSEPRATLEHDEEVESASFSPDGRRVVTASRDRSARVWDADTGTPVGRSLTHDDFVHAAVFSPDGRRVATASHDETARVWDADTGQPLIDPIQTDSSVLAVAFSPDGRRLVTGSWSGTVQVWDSVTGQPVGDAFKHTDRVNTVVFSPDGDRILTASQDYTAQVWDAFTGQRVATALQHKLGVLAAAFSPDGRRVVTASVDGTAQIWDAMTSQPIGAPMRHQRSVNAAAFSPDGRLVGTASSDGTARVWDATTGQSAGAPLRHEGYLSAVAFSPEGRRVVTASSDTTARVWNVLLDLPSLARVQLLADLAEVVGGNRVTESGSVVPLDDAERRQRVRRLVDSDAPFEPVESLLRSFLDVWR